MIGSLKARLPFVLGAVTAFGLALAAPAKAQTEMVVASIGGNLDEVMKKATAAFEQAHNVKIRWVPSLSAEKLAKIEAAKAAPEFDLAMLDDPNHVLGSARGLWEKIDRSVVTNWDDLYTQAQGRKQDGVGVGFFVAGFFYRTDEFQKRGWAPPRKWDDLFRPEFCGSIGLMHPNVSYTIHTLLMLSGGDPKKIDTGIERLGKLKNCIPVLEPSAPKFEEKIQLGEYLVGINGAIRTIPLAQKGVPVKFVLPEDGTVSGVTMLAPVKNAPRAKLAQELCNWVISPDVQKIIVENLYYGPVNKKVVVTKEQKEIGVLDAEATSKLIVVDEGDDLSHRRNWVRNTERVMAR